MPGTLATWESAARKWGTKSLGSLLQPAARVAERGFPVDATFRQQVTDNAAAFGQFESTSDLYLPGGAPPAVGSTLRNPDLADTYRLIARRGTGVFYSGAVGRDIVRTVQQPPVAADPIGAWAYPIRGADLRMSDLADYQVRYPAPTKSGYRGLAVYGMSTPSSGGTAVGEALNILEKADLSEVAVTQALHQYLEATALAFADRNRYVGAYTPQWLLDQLISDGWAGSAPARSTRPTALAKPVAPGDIDATRLHPGRRRRPRSRRARARPTSPSPTSGATSSSTRSPSSRPAATAWSCRAAGSCSTTS